MYAETASQSRNGYVAGFPPQCGGHKPRTIKRDSKMGSWKLQPDGGYKYPETTFGVPLAPVCPPAPGFLPYPDLHTSGMPFQPSGEGYYPESSQQPYPGNPYPVQGSDEPLPYGKFPVQPGGQ
ncbi:hypothetical protein CSKR_203301 [Clonorchis sinensis]|uniref:Uncharacterized protein n=1 Tax=Clonorchis sinensis TaxID=79923 RepID=A0A8T1MA78_CLOSI|nr:hypothetical protein CSKR_203301 [Clonorchis sinensis]